MLIIPQLMSRHTGSLMTASLQPAMATHYTLAAQHFPLLNDSTLLWDIYSQLPTSYRTSQPLIVSYRTSILYYRTPIVSYRTPQVIPLYCDAHTGHGL